MAPHSSPLAWKIPWMEEPGRLQSVGQLRVGHDCGTSLSLFIFMHWRRKWQPTPVFLPGESQGRGSLMGCHLRGHTELDATEATQQQQQQLSSTSNSLNTLFPLPLAISFPSHCLSYSSFRCKQLFLRAELQLSRWHSGKESTYQCRRHKRCRFDPWVGKITWSRKWQPTPVLLPGESLFRRAWWVIVHGVSKSWTQWSN